MTAVSPTTVNVINIPYSLYYGADRRMFEAYIECSPAQDATMALTTYISNAAAITGILMSGDSSGLISTIASMPSFSTTTLTFTTAGAQFVKVIGYYT